MSGHSTMNDAADPSWDSLGDTICSLYLDNHLTLEQIRCEMANTYQFDRTKAQYELQFKKWKIRKNRTAEEWKAIAHKITKRKRQHKDSDVYLDGILINPKKLRREAVRYGSASATTDMLLQMPSPRTPEGIIVHTPSSKGMTPAPATSVAKSSSQHYYAPMQIETAPLLLDCLPFSEFNSMLIQDGMSDPIPACLIFHHTVRRAIVVMIDKSGELDRIFKPGCTSSADICFAENVLSSCLGRRISASVVVSQDVFSSVLNQFKEGKAPQPLVQTVKALMPANIFASNLENLPLALSQGQESSSVEFLKLTLFLISNNLFGATEEISKKIYEWIKRHSNVGLLEHILAIGGPTIEALAENFFTLAIDADDAHTVKKMIEWGINPNDHVYAVWWGWPITALQRACEMRSLELVRALIDGGAVVNISAQNGEPPSLLMCALQPDYYDGWTTEVKFIWKTKIAKREKPLDTELVRILLNERVAVNPGLRESPLSKAAEIGHEEAVDLLISAGADVHFLNMQFHHPPLMDAVSCSVEIPNERVICIVRSLLAAGADANAIKDYDGDVKTVLEAAMPRQSVELIQLLLENGARITESAFAAAAKYCGLNISTLLLKSGARISELVIQNAVEFGDSELFWSLLNEADASILARCKSAAMIRGIACDRMDLTESLDASGAILEKSWQLVDAMSAAAERGDVSVFRFLLGGESRHRIPVSQSLGRPLLSAILNGRSDIAEILLGAGADVNEMGKSERGTALLAAIGLKDLQLVKKLLTAGAAVNFNSGGSTFTVLPAVVAWGLYPLILDIINAGAEVNAPDIKTGKLALSIAVGMRDFRIVKLLIEAGADVNATHSDRGQTALETASRNKDVDMVRYLLSLGADPDEASLLIAVSGSVELIQMLLTARLNRYQRFSQRYGCGALQRSVLLENPEMIEILLTHGIDSNVIVHLELGHFVAKKSRSVKKEEQLFPCYGDSAFGSAIRTDKSNDLWIVHKLLRCGADPNSIVIEDFFCQTALLAAVDQNNPALVNALITAGANPNHSTGHRVNRTPLQLAVENGRCDIVDILLSHGADVNAPADYRRGATALQFAASGGYVPLAHLLLERGADVNALPAKVGGRTALEAAAEHGRIDMLKLLLNAGALITGPGGEQYDRAREFATQNGHASARRLLEKYYHTLQENTFSWDETSMDLEFFNTLSFETVN